MDIRKIIKEEIEDFDWEKDEFDWIRDIGEIVFPITREILTKLVGWSFMWDRDPPKRDWGYNGKKWVITDIKNDRVYYSVGNKINSNSINHMLGLINIGDYVLVSPTGVIYYI